ncbi:universal stress protein [Hoeflea sp. AS16]|uniref:universal stress protein n=1 Tax=Hoeflea sp. AS16 TaxID=3135779 RepID=UPI00317D93AF
MYKKIMVPVDLAHADKLALALDTAANLSKIYHAPITYVGVTSSAPGPLGHNPAEYDKKLADFIAAQAKAHGIETHGKTIVSHDPAVDLDNALIKAVDETGSDLVVMATHIPNVADHFWPSNGGRLATHTKASVFLVRG